MTEQQEKARFKQAVDHTLSGVQGDPLMAQRVLARAEKGAKIVKYHIPKGIVIALIALLCMGTAAVAAGLYGGTINWKGELQEATKSEWNIEAVLSDEEKARMQRVEEAAAQLTQDGEAILISVQEAGRSWVAMRCGLAGTVEDTDAFMKRIASAEDIPIPAFIPDGYEMTKGKVEYACRADGVWNLVERIAYDDDIVAERYRADEEHLLACGYSLYYLDPLADAHLVIQVSLKPRQDAEAAVISFSEAPETVRSIAVSGMDDAVVLEEDSYTLLAMRKTLENPTSILECQGDVIDLEEAVIIVDAQNIDADALICMFASE